MELRAALGLALLCAALEAAPAGPQPRSAAGQFWHVSDLHLDPTYHITSDRTKVCSSSKGANASNPGPFGDFLCDSPYQLILSAFAFMKDSKEQVSFMIWTGDSPPHVPVKELSTKLVISIIGNMSSTIRSFFPDLQVFPALGNHDYWPQDQLPVTTSEVYNAVADFWKPWLNDEAINTFRKGGFYTQLFESGDSSQPLRIISLNTNLYYSPNSVTVNITDPADQFAWLEGILETSSEKKEKVYIIGHVPIGYLPYARNTTAIREYYNERLVKIFRKYSSVIVGQFFGHTHRDSIMVLLDEEEKPVNSLFVAPAVTPVKNVWQMESNNPGVRLYQYDFLDYSLLVYYFFRKIWLCAFSIWPLKMSCKTPLLFILMDLSRGCGKMDWLCGYFGHYRHPNHFHLLGIGPAPVKFLILTKIYLLAARHSVPVEKHGCHGKLQS
ncbi:cyclic GMP-AMP phosphodiesterase SMPDL3A isoform X2 [Pithys albifrons albifrons]|uniref:cyclic GMP-AMP phosphodiesterase SMPDL3A isoform X2 n=1 Tax=Pithys albifrons albifrons TaxID=3385563 RepID=UPI003A5D0456